MYRHAGIVCVLLAAALWSLVGSVSLYCMRNGIEPIEISFWRNLTSGILFTGHALLNRTFRVDSLRDGCAVFFLGALCFGGMNICYQNTVLTGGAALASVLTYTAPIWVAICSRLLYKEAMGLCKAASIGMMVMGISLLAFSGANQERAIGMQAICLGLGSGFMYALFFLFSKVYLDRYSVFTIYGVSMLGAALLLLPSVTFSPEKSPVVWGLILFLGVFCSYVAYWVYGMGSKRLPLTQASVMASIDPMLATCIAWLWWDELFTPKGWAGAVLCIGAVLLVIMERNREIESKVQEQKSLQSFQLN